MLTCSLFTLVSFLQPSVWPSATASSICTESTLHSHPNLSFSLLQAFPPTHITCAFLRLQLLPHARFFFPLSSVHASLSYFPRKCCFLSFSFTRFARFFTFLRPFLSRAQRDGGYRETWRLALWRGDSTRRRHPNNTCGRLFPTNYSSFLETIPPQSITASTL